MRMRRMKNLDPRMEKCAEYRIAEPAALKGNWRSLKSDATQLWVEVGCGKGKFTAETAQANPDVLMIAVERCRDKTEFGDRFLVSGVNCVAGCVYQEFLNTKHGFMQGNDGNPDSFFVCKSAS